MNLKAIFDKLKRKKIWKKLRGKGVKEIDKKIMK